MLKVKGLNPGVCINVYNVKITFVCACAIDKNLHARRHLHVRELFLLCVRETSIFYSNEVEVLGRRVEAWLAHVA